MFCYPYSNVLRTHRVHHSYVRTSALPAIFPPAETAPAPCIRPYNRFMRELKQHRYDQVIVAPDLRSLITHTKSTVSDEICHVRLPYPDASLQNTLAITSPEDTLVWYEEIEESSTSPSVGMVLLSSMGIYFVAVMLMQRGMVSMQRGSAGKVHVETEHDLTLADVAGIESAKVEILELVEFLQDPERFRAMGARIPHGYILHGPPGCGKTMIAKALAGEADVPFLACSASEFVEMFVGVGASRIREVFERARQQSPCIVFLDEIDAIGKSRSSAGTPSNDEREQTLNQLLTEMDGFHTKKGKDDPPIVVLAATNRLDVLDRALLRPGRFDRKIEIQLPTVWERQQIFTQHMGKKPHTEFLDLVSYAEQTTGFTGADIANLTNEAAIIACRNHHSSIEVEDMDAAYQRILIGLPSSRVLTSERLRLVAYHEAGHAVLGLLCEDVYDQVTNVSVMARGSAGGMTIFRPDAESSESGMYTKEYMEASLFVAMGGRAAEEIVFGTNRITTGASNDIQVATQIATQMVKEWGFCEFVGNVNLAILPPSESTQKEVDDAIRNLIHVQYMAAFTTLTTHRVAMDYVAEELLRHGEYVPDAHVRSLLAVSS